MSDPAFAAFINNISSPNFQNNIQTLSAASANLKASSDAIAKGAAQLSDSTADLVQFQSAVSTIKNGLEQAKTGSGQLASGSAALASGMGSLNHAAGQLQNGLNAIQGSVSASAEDASDQVKNLNGLDEYAENSVTIDNDSINPVPNYGTAFAPYFLSLSLWVGALIIFVGTYLDSDEKFKILSQHSNNKIIRTLLFLLLAFTQAVALAIIVKLCLGLHVNHPVLYFLSCGLVSMVFLSIVQFLMVFLKDIGKFLSLLLLIVQLTSVYADDIFRESVQRGHKRRRYACRDDKRGYFIRYTCRIYCLDNNYVEN
jgi:putative membrane protein